MYFAIVRSSCVKYKDISFFLYSECTLNIDQNARRFEHHLHSSPMGKIHSGDKKFTRLAYGFG